MTRSGASLLGRDYIWFARNSVSPLSCTELKSLQDGIDFKWFTRLTNAEIAECCARGETAPSDMFGPLITLLQDNFSGASVKYMAVVFFQLL